MHRPTRLTPVPSPLRTRCAHSSWNILTFGLASCSLVAACSTAPSVDERGARPADAVTRADDSTRPSRAHAMQRLARAMADDWRTALLEAADLAEKGAAGTASNADPRAGARTMLRDALEATLATASEPDQGAAVLDLLTLSSLQCWALRTNPAGAGLPRADAERALARLERGREGIWSQASREIDAKNIADLRLLVDAWVKANPDETRVATVRFADLASQRGGLSGKERERAAAILGSVAAPASAEDSARLFGERMLWYIARYPSLLGAQAESTAARIAQSGERSDRESRAALADTLAKERAAFGETLAAERKALAAAATTERKAIAGSLGEERAALADALGKERAALADALGKTREAWTQDLAREREALVAGVREAIDASGERAKSEREALAKWAGDERALLAEDLEARLVKLVDRALIGAGIVIAVLLVGLAVLRFVPQRRDTRGKGTEA